MKIDVARTILVACRPLASKLAAQGVDIELTNYDHEALRHFNMVVNSDRLRDSDIYRQAGLGRADIANLSYRAAQHKAGKI